LPPVRDPVLSGVIFAGVGGAVEVGALAVLVVAVAVDAGLVPPPDDGGQFSITAPLAVVALGAADGVATGAAALAVGLAVGSASAFFFASGASADSSSLSSAAA
jgi:hypothetical protein